MAFSTVETYAKLGDIAPAGATIDKQRRLFNFGDRISEIEPMSSPWFSYLNKLRKIPTDDPSFKFLEQRHQWQRRNFYNYDAVSASDPDGSITSLAVKCYYDKYGRTVSTGVQPKFFVINQLLGVQATDDSDSSIQNIVFKISAVDVTTDTTEANLTVAVHSVNGDTTAANWPAAMSIAIGAEGQVIGSAFAEGTGAPLGWRDELYDRDGYTQIFKTAIPLFTGTARATKYRGVANEYLRVWKEKLKEHKMDMATAALFGVGKAGTGTSSTPSYTWGIMPYVELYGNSYDFIYASSSYDTFLDHMENYFAPETGNSSDKLVLASRKVINWFNKLGEAGFLKNTVGSSSYRFDVANVRNQFGHNVTRVNTIFGNLHFVQEPLLRGWMEDYAIAVDLKNVAWRPLKANGISRDTWITTNVQDNDIDGRKDIITTEAGVQIDIPETHAILKFT